VGEGGRRPRPERGRDPEIDLETSPIKPRGRRVPPGRAPILTSTAGCLSELHDGKMEPPFIQAI